MKLGIRRKSNFALLLLFSLVSATYLLGAPVCGWFIDRWPRACPKMMLSGSLMCAVAILFMGPSPLIPLTKSIASMCGSFLFLGFAITLVLIPTFQHCINEAKLEIEGNPITSHFFHHL
jgi:MFS family permease